MEDDLFNKYRRIGIILCVILILAIVGLLVFKKVNKKTIKENNEEVTQVIKKEEQRDVELYSNSIKQLFENSNDILLYDTTTKKIDFYADKKCDKVGAKVNLNSNGYTVNYTCIKDLTKKNWEIKGKINNIIDFDYSTNNTIKHVSYYRINNYIMKVESGNNFNSTSIVIYDAKTGEEKDNIKQIVTPYTYDENDKKYNSNIYIKKGILYYHSAINTYRDEISDELVSDECIIRKIDLNSDYNNVEVHNYACSYIDGN